MPHHRYTKPLACRPKPPPRPPPWVPPAPPEPPPPPELTKAIYERFGFGPPEEYCELAVTLEDAVATTNSLCSSGDPWGYVNLYWSDCDADELWETTASDPGCDAPEPTFAGPAWPPCDDCLGIPPPPP